MYSTIYRVGRVNENAFVKARIIVDDKPVDVRVDESVKELFFDAVKSGICCEINIDAAWYPSDNDQMDFDAEHSRLVGLEPSETFSGADFLEKVRSSPVPLFDDIEAIIEDLEGF